MEKKFYRAKKLMGGKGTRCTLIKAPKDCQVSQRKRRLFKGENFGGAKPDTQADHGSREETNRRRGGSGNNVATGVTKGQQGRKKKRQQKKKKGGTARPDKSRPTDGPKRKKSTGF